MPWGKAYYLPGEMTDQTIAHETEHLKQIERDGPFWFSLRYIAWLIWFGYYWNPYEVAARVNCGEEEFQPGYANSKLVGPLLNDQFRQDAR